MALVCLSLLHILIDYKSVGAENANHHWHDLKIWQVLPVISKTLKLLITPTSSLFFSESDAAAVLSWLPIIQRICFRLQPCHRAFAKGGSERSINGPAQQTKSAPVELSHLRQIHISYFLHFHADGGGDRGESKMSLLSWHCSYPPWQFDVIALSAFWLCWCCSTLG